VTEHQDSPPAHDGAQDGAEPPAPEADAGTPEDPARRRQAGILRDLATRLEDGEPALPTDVFALLGRELDLRVDDGAIAAAWSEQGERKAEPWVFCRGRAQG
jgi:hypothetical protein